jgi:septum formation protein
MEINNNINNYQLILASQSPRRQHLLKELGLDFEIQVKAVDEVYPPHLLRQEIPMYLSKLKADAFATDLKHGQLVITADTIVWLNEAVLGKPIDYNDAFTMLKNLSGNMHTVYTGVCLKSVEKEKSFWASTDVYFKNLSDAEIKYYLENYKPYDKAGSYGIQEWIGYIGIKRIEGSYFNVMGLPIQKLYDELQIF